MITMIKPAALMETKVPNFRKDGINCSQVMHLTTLTGKNEARPENSRAVERKNKSATVILNGFRIADCISGQMICA
jgi:hypothetical protein